MKVYAVATMGGEGEVRAYKTAAAAVAAAASEDGCALERPPTSVESFATGFPVGYAVPGDPASVWLVLCGDRGCTNGFAGAFADQAAAEALAKHLESKGGLGLSFWTLETKVTG